MGCATGSYLEHAAAKGWRVSGVEGSPFARQQASDRLGIPVRSSLSELAPGERFDVVTLHHVLEHVIDPVPFLRDEVAPRVDIPAPVVCGSDRVDRLVESGAGGECSVHGPVGIDPGNAPSRGASEEGEEPPGIQVPAAVLRRGQRVDPAVEPLVDPRMKYPR